MCNEGKSGLTDQRLDGSLDCTEVIHMTWEVSSRLAMERIITTEIRAVSQVPIRVSNGLEISDDYDELGTLCVVCRFNLPLFPQIGVDVMDCCIECRDNEPLT